MATARSTSTFNCPACGGHLEWSEKIIGRTILCACGKSVQVPARPHSAAAAEDAYDLSDEPVARTPSAPVPVAARAQRVLKYQDVPVVEQSNWREAIRGSEFRHLILPICFLVFAVLARLGFALFASSNGTGQTLAMVGAAIAAMGLSTVCTFIAVGVVARFTGSDLGPLPIAILKLTATAIMGSVVLGVGMSMIPTYGGSAGIVAWHVALLVYWIMFSMFFELDLQETLFAVAIVGVLNAGVMLILWQH